MCVKYRRRLKALSGIALAAFMCSVSPVSAFATSTSALQSKQADVRKNAQTAMSNLNKTINEKNNLIYEVAVLDYEFLVANTNYQLVCEQLERTIELKEQTMLELSNAEADYDAQMEAFAERLRYMHESGVTGYLQILLTSKNFSDFLNRMDIINAFIDLDKNIIDNLKASEQLVAEKLAAFERIESEMTALKYEQEIYLAELDEILQEKGVLIEQLEAQEDTYQQMVDELEAESKNIEKMIKDSLAAAAKKSASASASQYVGGVLGWPVPGYNTISSPYGNRTHPINKKYSFHSGIDIPAPKGNNVVAAGDGTVLFAGWQGSYGYLVVIDHGGGIHTAYAHNSSLVVKVNQKVTKGSVIAKIGSTGYSTGPHCHFEVRKNGSAVEPTAYLKK